MEDQVLAAKDEVESLQNMVCKLERRRQDAGEGAFLRYYVGVYAAPADARFNGYAPIALPGINVGKSVVVRDAEAEGELEVDGPVVLLHELGHAMGRDHVLCDHEPEPHDEDFPFKGGSIGSWGVDLDRVQHKDPARVHDIMSYCLPAWVSDFTYRHILEALADDSDSVRRRRARSSALVVSGTIGPAGPSLEPVLTVSTSTAAPAAGPDTVVLRDAGGAAIRSLTFSPEVAAEGAAPSGERSFLFDIPISPKEEEALASLEVITPQGETKVLRAAPSAGAQDRPAAVALPHGQVLLVWDQTLHPEVTARDPRNGAILGTGSKGELHLATDAGQLELELLDGLKTMRLQVPVQRRP